MPPGAGVACRSEHAARRSPLRACRSEHGARRSVHAARAHAALAHAVKHMPLSACRLAHAAWSMQLSAFTGMHKHIATCTDLGMQRHTLTCNGTQRQVLIRTRCSGMHQHAAACTGMPWLALAAYASMHQHAPACSSVQRPAHSLNACCVGELTVSCTVTWCHAVLGHAMPW